MVEDAAQDIRIANPSEYERLRQIELAADEMFLEVGIGPFLQDEEENRLEQAAVVLVFGRPPVGFACIEIVDGVAHLWQLAVLPSQSCRGFGTALVSAVCEWAASNGYEAVTLTTFRDVPWNARFYAKLGFRTIDDLSPGLAAIRDHEIEIGDDDFGPRVAMRKKVEPMCG